MKSSNIVWHETAVTRADREKKNNHKGIVLWMTGLSGSGKSTVASKLEEKLFSIGCNVFVLDGDNVRHGLNSDLGFSPEDRDENIRRIGEVAHLFAESGMIIITSFISPYQKDRDIARKLNREGEFFEIYVKAGLDVCEKRDPKKLYKKARAGIISEFTGISAPYEEPENPEITIETDLMSVEKSIKKIVDYLRVRNIIN